MQLILIKELFRGGGREGEEAGKGGLEVGNTYIWWILCESENSSRIYLIKNYGVFHISQEILRIYFLFENLVKNFMRENQGKNRMKGWKKRWKNYEMNAAKFNSFCLKN